MRGEGRGGEVKLVGYGWIREEVLDWLEVFILDVVWLDDGLNGAFSYLERHCIC